MLSSVSTSPFLNLPAELRNHIVAYALTTSARTLQYMPNDNLHSEKPIFEDPQQPDHEFNQLKYVCKQLYYETAGLEIKYNALRFDLPEDDAYTLARIQDSLDSGFSSPTLLLPIASTSFPPFLYTCSKTKVTLLREIIIAIRKPASYSLNRPMVDRLLGLDLFSKENPRIKITYEYVDEVYEYKSPKYQQFVPWLSVAVCLGAALPLPVAWKPAADLLRSVCGR